MKSFFKMATAHGLIESAEYLLEHIEDSEFCYNQNKYALILVASASLESLLNDGIVNWAFNTFDRDNYKRHATAFLSMNLGKKLDALGFLFTNGKLITNNQSSIYQSLIGLIKTRNEVAHSKDFYSEVELEYGEFTEDGGQQFTFPKEVIAKMQNTPLSLSKRELEEAVSYLKELKSILRYELKPEDSLLFKPN